MKVYKFFGTKSQHYKVGHNETPVAVLAPGDRVKLGWYGDSGIPRYQDGNWATVEHCNPKRLVVYTDATRFHRPKLLSINPERHVTRVEYAKGEK